MVIGPGPAGLKFWSKPTDFVAPSDPLLETEVFSATLTGNDSGDGNYSMRSIFPVTGMSDAAFLVLVTDYGATSSARTLTGLGTITGPGSGADTTYTAPFDSYRLAHELNSVIPGTIYNVNSVKIRGSGTAREICARLEASSAATTNIDNVSIGIWNGTTSSATPYQGSTTFTPVELKWSGASGISMSAGTMSAYSDWTAFPDNVKGVYGPTQLANANGGWAGYTLVTVLNAADLRAAGGGTEVRIAIVLNVASAGQTTDVYIAQQATSGDAYDFKGTPSRFTWSGSGTITHDGTTLLYISDWVTLPEAWDNTKNYCVAFQFSAGGTTDIRYNSGATVSGISYYKGAVEAATVDKSGYASLFSGNVVLTEILEVKTPSSVSYNETITAGTIPIDGATITPVNTVNTTETITAGAVPIVGSSIAPVYGINEAVTAGAVPIVGATLADVFAHSDTITAGALPIVGATLADVFARSDTITAGSLPITGQAIVPIHFGHVDYVEPAITAGSLPITGATLADVFARSDTITAGALPIAGQSIVPVFEGAAGTTWVKVGSGWVEAITYVKHDGVWVRPVATFVKDAGDWKELS